jgi:predicted RNase H-like nuclease (RuvC/YqgF family)
MTEQNPNPNPEPQPQNNNDGEILDKFNEIKERYETELSDKDKEIEELKKQLQDKNKEVDNTIQNLNDEVNDKLEQAEKIKSLQATVDELVEERAEATVDAYVQKGIILPAQREAAKKLCLTDNDTFLDLYRDAKPIVETDQKRKSVPAGTAERIANYFKN